MYQLYMVYMSISIGWCHHGGMCAAAHSPCIGLLERSVNVGCTWLTSKHLLGCAGRLSVHQRLA
jgi:hypothetical protein